MSSATCWKVGNGVAKVEVARSNCCSPVPEGEGDKPISMTATLFEASTATPQFIQLPPEKSAVLLAPLVSVLVIVVPDTKYTSVLFATHTETPVLEFVEQELGTLGVGIATPQAPAQAGSMGIA